jgi:hypothetical protein
MEEAKMSEDKISYRTYLEVQKPDGTTAFMPTKKILLDPDLQEQCLEKEVLRDIIKKLREAGALDEELVIRGPNTRQ